MSARLYGRAVGHGSLSVVTAGFHQALSDAGVLNGFVATDKSSDGESDDPPGALARDGVFTGNLSQVYSMMRGAKHRRHWVQVTPNSTYVPPMLLAAVLGIPGVNLLSASAWGTRVITTELRKLGFDCCEFDCESDRPLVVAELSGRQPVEVLTVRHGISGAFKPDMDQLDKTRKDFANGQFRVVHFSTTDGERKGTLELVQAWRILMAGGGVYPAAELLLVLDHHARAALEARLLDEGIGMPAGVRILPRADMDDAAMARFLCQQHVVCTPSRGEGFGLLCLQGRACGVPVVTTRTTGHSAGHCTGPGVVPIRQNAAKLVEIDDGPGALAPAVDPNEIAVSLHASYQGWEGLSSTAECSSEYVSKAWSWSKQLAPLVEKLR